MTNVLNGIDNRWDLSSTGTAHFWWVANYTEIEAGWTLVFKWDATVFDDLNFDPSSSWWNPVTLPDFVIINNVVHREFTSSNNQICWDWGELPHSYKLSSQIYQHLHIFLKSGESAGTTGVQFTLYRELRQSTGTTSWSSVLSATSAQLWTTAWANKLDLYDVTWFAWSSGLGAQLSLTLARTGWNAGDVIITTYWVHYEIDMVGSHTTSTK